MEYGYHFEGIEKEIANNARELRSISDAVNKRNDILKQSSIEPLLERIATALEVQNQLLYKIAGTDEYEWEDEEND